MTEPNWPRQPGDAPRGLAGLIAQPPGPLAVVLLTLLAAALLLPFLGASGFWDPYEIKLADAARAIVADGYRLALTAGRPPGLSWIIGFGFSMFGVGEVGGRLPLALAAVATIPALYYAAAPFIGRRAALFGGLVLLTSSGFVLGARQLTSSAPSLLAICLAVGGVGRALLPSRTKIGLRLVHALAGAAGLAIGLFCTGILSGVVAPLFTVAIGLWAAGAGLAAGAASGLALISLGSWLGVFLYQLFVRSNDHVTAHALLGGGPHAPQHAIVYTQHLVRLVNQLFPWSVLLLPAAAAGLAVPASSRETPDEQARRAPSLIVAWLAVSWATSVAQGMLIADAPPTSMLPLALGIGLFLDTALAEGPPQPFAALVIALSAAMISHDVFAQPDVWIGSHLFDNIRWPGPLGTVAAFLLVIGGFVGAALALGTGMRLAPRYSSDSDTRQRENRALFFAVAAGVSLITAFGIVYYVVPSVSKHLSARDLYGKTKALDPSAPLGQYRFQASSGAYYLGGRSPVDLRSVDEVFTFLGKPERVFVLAGSDELATLDQRARQTSANFYVVDDTNSRFLVVSNRLNSGEVDKNPLRRFVSSTAPQPAHPVEADFEGKVKLIGWDMPMSVERGQDFRLRLYFQVLQTIDKPYKLFVHFDGQGARFHGDHLPLDGKLPTTAWVPGTYITDENLIKPEKSMQPSGTYKIYAGFWLGDARLKVTSGPQDGDNRVLLGTIVVK
jgi:4-amino-4-deoxy-L-arabinose transferase-like glycosyltransferase